MDGLSLERFVGPDGLILLLFTSVGGRATNSRSHRIGKTGANSRLRTGPQPYRATEPPTPSPTFVGSQMFLQSEMADSFGRASTRRSDQEIELPASA